MDGVAAWF